MHDWTSLPGAAAFARAPTAVRSTRLARPLPSVAGGPSSAGSTKHPSGLSCGFYSRTSSFPALIGEDPGEKNWPLGRKGVLVAPAGERYVADLGHELPIGLPDDVHAGGAHEHL